MFSSYKWFFRIIFILTCTVCHVSLSDTTTIRCYKNSFSNYKEASLSSPETLIKSDDPYINTSKCTKFFVFGWTGTPTGFAVSTLIPTLISETCCNVCLLNWEKKASGGILGPLLGYYPSVLPAVKEVGIQFGQALLKLKDAGLKIDEVHLIGHSAGAHLACYAGRETIKQGVTLTRITGLDPARPGFDPEGKYLSIDTSCAKLVDLLHTDLNGFGMNKSMGHVDIWPNFGEFRGGDDLQPGCEKLSSAMDLFANGNMCNHNRAVELYNASLTFNEQLECGVATDYDEYVEANGNFESTNYIGPAVVEANKGNCYLSTTGTYSFGKGADGLEP